MPAALCSVSILFSVGKLSIYLYLSSLLLSSLAVSSPLLTPSMSSEFQMLIFFGYKMVV